MILDSSALVAILLREPEAERLARAVRKARFVRLSAVTFVEASIVMTRYHDAAGPAAVDQWLDEHGVTTEAVTAAQAAIARTAFLRFGKGRHPAALNFGDCFSYALARERDEPLLFVGDDFARTDLRAAVG